MLCLSQRLQQLGSRLVVRRARESAQALKELAQETGAQAVFFNHLYDSISMVRDQQVKDELRAQGVLTSTFNADLLYEPWEVLDEQRQVSSRQTRLSNSISTLCRPVAPSSCRYDLCGASRAEC